MVRRYKTVQSCAAEADLMRYLREAGYPVPDVFAVDGPDLVMQRLHGRDMLADLIAAPAAMARPLGPGGRVLHLDLHPGNVMLTADGPFVIDWTNGRAGEAGADVAMAYLIMASSDIDGLPWWLTPVTRELVQVFLNRFRAAVHDDLEPHLARAAEYRLHDPQCAPRRGARLQRLAGLGR